MSRSRKPSWSEYYRVTANRPPRELLVRALRLLPPATGNGRAAIDIGCGAGVECLELLRQGWSVLAIDRSAAAIAHLKRVAPRRYARRLKTRIARAERVALPPVDFIWAGASLPFLGAREFRRLWRHIVAALKPGGFFAGDLFGRRHSWSGARGMNFHGAREIRALCRPLKVELLVTEEGRCLTAVSGFVHWHAFGIVAKKSLRR